MTNPSNPTMPSAPDFLSWQEVEKLIDYILPQLRGPYDALMMITRGGIVPGGLIAEALEMPVRADGRRPVPRGRAGAPGVAHVPPVPGRPASARQEDPDHRRHLGKRPDDHNRQGPGARRRRPKAEAAVLHYKPGSNLFREAGPDYYAAVTDRFIVYPWEVQRGPDEFNTRVPQFN